MTRGKIKLRVGIIHDLSLRGAKSNDPFGYFKQSQELLKKLFSRDITLETLQSVLKE
jgi:hypothetical protein